MTFDRSEIRSVFLRRPGEDRNLRMVHAIGHQNFLADGIVGDRRGPAEIHASLTLFRAANDPQRRTSPLAISGYTVAEEFPRFETHSS